MYSTGVRRTHDQWMVPDFLPIVTGDRTLLTTEPN